MVKAQMNCECKVSHLVMNCRNLCRPWPQLARAAVMMTVWGFVLAAVASAGGTSPFGVCAHVGCDEFTARDREFALMKEAGIGWVRSDFLWRDIEPRSGQFSFEKFDILMESAEKAGIEVLPILCYDNPVYPDYAWQHPQAWCAYAEAVVKRYRHRLKAVEVWNEPNIPFWGPAPDASQYARLLKLTYDRIKSVAPEILVVMGGTAGTDIPFLEKLYDAGLTAAADVVNIHPYCWPSRPEGNLDANIRRVRELMNGRGDGAKPLWITELGWPTHKVQFKEPYVLISGLRVALGGDRAWNCLFAKLTDDDCLTERYAAELGALMPAGSRARALAPSEFLLALAAGDVDAVFYPFSERYPVETSDAVVDFVAKGGTLVCAGGIPLFYALRNGRPAGEWSMSPEGVRDRQRLRIAWEAWWTSKCLPERLRTFMTGEAREAGCKTDPAGCEALRFFSATALKPGDRMVPLLAGRDSQGGTAVAACVYRFDSDMKGSVVVSSVGTMNGVTDEAQQAVLLSRALALATEMGVEKYFCYELQAPEADPHYSEHHFGICHRDFKPKPAYRAYAAFTRLRPVESVSLRASWHDEKNIVYFPRWKRPDGRNAGMIWTIADQATTIKRTFAAEPTVFYDVFGGELKLKPLGNGVYEVPVSESPVYWVEGVPADVPE